MPADATPDPAPSITRWTIWPCPECGEVLASEPDDSGCVHSADHPAPRMAEPLEVVPLTALEAMTAERDALAEKADRDFAWGAHTEAKLEAMTAERDAAKASANRRAELLEVAHNEVVALTAKLDALRATLTSDDIVRVAARKVYTYGWPYGPQDPEALARIILLAALSAALGTDAPDREREAER